MGRVGVGVEGWEGHRWWRRGEPMTSVTKHPRSHVLSSGVIGVATSRYMVTAPSGNKTG
ncbi:unnamed protein product [Calypogeia fissa]